MAQLDTIGHVVVREAVNDITAGLDAGVYAAQARQGLVYWSTASAAPTNLGAYERSWQGNFFWFRAGPDRPPCWARSGDGAGNLIVPRAKVIEGRVIVREHLAATVLTTNPVELLDGEDDGEYVITPSGADVYWASGAAAPALLSDFFRTHEDGKIVFCREAASPVSLWMRAVAGQAQAIPSRSFGAGP